MVALRLGGCSVRRQLSTQNFRRIPPFLNYILAVRSVTGGTMDWTFGFWIAVGMVLSSLAFGFTANINFDIARLLSDRKSRRLNRVRHLCPHAYLTDDGHGGLGVASCFVSPPGTSAHVCERCGTIVHHKATVNQVMYEYVKNPNRLMQATAAQDRAAKKAELI